MVMTAWSSFDLAVEAMRRGACDFIQKPWDNLELLQKLQTQFRWHAATASAAGARGRTTGCARDSGRACFPSDCPKLLDTTCGHDAAFEICGRRLLQRGAHQRPRDSILYRRCGGQRHAGGTADVELACSTEAPYGTEACAGGIVSPVNRILCDFTPVGKFCSFFYGVLDQCGRIV